MLAPPRPRIPLKKDLLLFNKALTKDISSLTKDNNVKDMKISSMEQKNEKLETAIRDIIKKLLQEKKASNVLIDKSKPNSGTAVTKAYCILNQSQNKKTTVEAWKLAEKMRSSTRPNGGPSPQSLTTSCALALKRLIQGYGCPPPSVQSSVHLTRSLAFQQTIPRDMGIYLAS